MARRVFLHVGAPKAGSTFVQSVLWSNRDRLRRAGMLLPGRRQYDHNLAMLALRHPEWKADESNKAHATWRRMTGRIRDWTGDALLTNEWFVRATEEQAAQAHRELGAAEVHVVYVARAYVDQTPAAWQELLKRGLSQSIPEFVASLDDEANKYSWWTLDPIAAIERWRAGIPSDRAHVVTVPPAGSEPGLLWRRLASVLGLDAAAYETTTAESNPSLSAEAARLLELLGPSLREAIDADAAHWTEPYRWIRGFLGHELLVSLGWSPIGLPPDLAAAMHARSARAAERLSSGGYDVIGDLDDLLVRERPPGSRDPATVTDAELLDVAVPVVAGLLGRIRDATRRAEGLPGGPRGSRRTG